MGSEQERPSHLGRAFFLGRTPKALNPMSLPNPDRNQRLLEGGRLTLKTTGLERRVMDDLYYHLMAARWRVVIGWLVLSWLGLNLVFALLYWSTGAVIEGARPGSFADAFFFSIQTITTVGYGGLAPGNLTADILMTLESISGLVSIATASGIFFAKFSKPTARIRFSSSPVIGNRDGLRCLMFRVGNTRGNNIADAQLRAVLTRLDRTPEGESVRRFQPLALTRPSTPLFPILWMGVHPIDDRSPLRGMSAEELEEVGAQVLVTVLGIDEDLGQPLHASYSYLASDIVWDARLDDMVHVDGKGQRVVDFRNFHAVRPESDEPHSSDEELA